MAKRLTETEGTNGPPVADPETERNYLRELISSKQEVDVYVGIHRNVVKQAKKAGINTKKMLEAISAHEVSLPETITNVKDYIRYCAMLNMPVTQVELFGKSAEEQISYQRTQDERTWDAGQGGYSAGKAGRKIDECPCTPGSEEDAEWRRQWHRGQEALAKVTVGEPASETTLANDSRQRTGSGGTRGTRAARKLMPDTAETVAAVVAEDEAEEIAL